MLLGSEQVEEFRSKGFIVLKGFLDEAVMEEVSAYLDKLRDKQPAEGQEAKYYEKSLATGENILVRIENVLGDNNPELGQLLLAPEAIE
ncbi:MAG: hypothetical protein QGF18_03405, partial [Alphaproteobacteria bacterium]|nr:hypothetical protein [Alphaproteobacteria bacterium]